MKLKNLKTKFLGRNVIYYKTIDSTQNEIWRLVENDIQNGTLVMADIQTAGKGTHGRTWYTEEANNIAFSFYIKLDCNIQKLDGLTVKIAEIIVDIMKDMYGIKLQIKSPNDIIFNNKKIGGILTQTKVVADKATDLVVGIGLNTSQKNFNEELQDIATSIKNEFNVNVNVQEFIAKFCNEFEKIVLFL